MTPENRVNKEIEAALMHYSICLIPRETWKLPISPWSMPDAYFHAGVAWRQNTGMGTFGRRRVRFGIPGQPDWEGWFFGRHPAGPARGLRFTIEAKSANGKASPDQAAYGVLAAHTGVFHALVRSYDECAAVLERWGLRRNSQ